MFTRLPSRSARRPWPSSETPTGSTPSTSTEYDLRPPMAGAFLFGVVSEDRFCSAIGYLERNPVRARMVVRAEEYRWSSAAAHCLDQPDSLLTPLGPTPQLISDWSAWLLEDDDPEELKAIRRSTRTGRPYASRSYLAQLERRLGRPLLPRKRRRRPKNPPPGEPIIWVK